MQPSIVRAGFVRAAASAIAALLVAASCTAPAPSQPAGESSGVGAPASTTVLTNGKIALLDSKNTIVAALAYRDGVILAVGTDDQAKQAAGPGAQVIDLKGRTVVPGLIDGTLHGVRNSVDCFLRQVRHDTTASRQDALAAYTARAKDLAPNTWIFTWSGWNVNQLDTIGMFTKAELDAALPNNPVLIQGVGFTGIQTNARGLAAMGVTAASTDPGVLKDSSGQPTGQLTGTAAALGRATMGKQLRTVSIDEQVACMKAFLREANRVGLTAWDDPAGNDQFDPQGRQLELLAGEHGYQAINQIHRDAQMTARIVLHFSCFTTGVPALDCVKQYTPTAVSLVGDDWLRIGGMGEELTTNMTNGLYPMPDYQLAVDYLAQNRWNLEHHAQSPAQQAEVVEAWERANAKASIKDLGWRMLHPFGGAAYPTNDVLGKLKALGAGVVLTNSNMQGQLTQEHPPYKRVYDSGTRMCLGTDALNVSTYAPFNNLWYTISGKTLDPAVVGVQPDQRLTRDQALRSATVNCAWFVHMENKVGTLEPGRYADFVVLSKDYFTVPVDEIRTITSVLTVAGGKVGWASGDFASLAPKQ